MEHPLSVAEQRRVLNSFLKDADDEKVQQLFSFFTSSMLDDAESSELAAAQLAEVFRRREAYLRGEMKGHPWREVMDRLRTRKSQPE